jgi:DNA-binding transcriptional LysR family regulator
VPAAHPPAGHDFAGLSDLHGQQRSLAGHPRTSRNSAPGRPGRPDTAHTARDWLAKLQLAASGYGLTTVPAVIAPGVRVLAARRGPEERRRVIVAHLPHRLPEPALRVIEALRAAATDTEAS